MDSLPRHRKWSLAMIARLDSKDYEFSQDEARLAVELLDTYLNRYLAAVNAIGRPKDGDPHA